MNIIIGERSSSAPNCSGGSATWDSGGKMKEYILNQRSAVPSSLKVSQSASHPGSVEVSYL